jgi:hypothetical protein
MTGKRQTSTEAVREWRKAHPDLVRAASKEANRRYYLGSRQKWAEIARQAAAEAAAEDDAR